MSLMQGFANLFLRSRKSKQVMDIEKILDSVRLSFERQYVIRKPIYYGLRGVEIKIKSLPEWIIESVSYSKQKVNIRAVYVCYPDYCKPLDASPRSAALDPRVNIDFIPK